MSKFKGLSKLARCGLAVIAVLAMVAPSAWASAPPPIWISTFEELQKIGRDPAYPLWEVYILMEDITMEPGWEPIGKWFVDPDDVDDNSDLTPFDILYAGAFTGTFFGNGHTIRGLSINQVDADLYNLNPALIMSAGFFGALDGAFVNNLTIEADSVNIAGFHEIAAGILAGFSRNSVILNVNVKGTVNAASVYDGTSSPIGAAVGGLVGKMTQGGITGSNSEVTVRSTSYSLIPSMLVRHDNRIGGLVGIVERLETETTDTLGTIYKSHATVVLSGNGISAGGLVGENRGATINQSSARTSGTDVNFLDVGGLVGSNHEVLPNWPEPSQWFDFPRIFQSYSEVNMNWTLPISARIGGLVGAHNIGFIQNSYSIGTLTGNTGAGYLGGFAGTIARLGCSGAISTSYAAVTLGTAQNVGGFVGGTPTPCHNADILVSSSYWDITVSGVDTSNTVGELGKTTAEMMQKSTFVNWWDFDLWQIDEGNSYPYLAWQSGHSTSISRDIVSRGVNRNSFAPTATVRGRTLNVRTSSPANLQVRLIDMRGRTMARFTTEGAGGSFSLSRISAGRYFVEMRDVANGQRFTSSVVVR
jgi:hypothetical protein